MNIYRPDNKEEERIRFLMKKERKIEKGIVLLQSGVSFVAGDLSADTALCDRHDPGKIRRDLVV